MEEMLEVPPEWNEVARGGEKGGKKMISALRNVHICPQCHREHGIQRDSTLKIGVKYSRKKMNGKRQISDRGFNRWCFVAEV